MIMCSFSYCGTCKIVFFGTNIDFTMLVVQNGSLLFFENSGALMLVLKIFEDILSSKGVIAKSLDSLHGFIYNLACSISIFLKQLSRINEVELKSSVYSLTGIYLRQAA